MSITLFDEAVLSDIPEVEDIPVETEYSSEDLAPTEIKNDTVVLNGDCPKPNQPPSIVQYTITPLKSGTGKMVTFYLNVLVLTDIIVNQFVILSDILIKPTDVMFVHLNSVLDTPMAYVLNNAIRSCRAKAKICVNPYVLSTPAIYPMLACDFIMPCKYGIMKFDPCVVMAGGNGQIDAKNALEFDTSRKMNMLICARNAGFLPPDKYDYIADKQGSYAIFGEALFNAIRRYNASHRKLPATGAKVIEQNPTTDANV